MTQTTYLQSRGAGCLVGGRVASEQPGVGAPALSGALVPPGALAPPGALVPPSLGGGAGEGHQTSHQEDQG